MIDCKRYRVTLELTEPLLGTVPKNREVYAAFVQSKAPEGVDTSDEPATVQEIEERGWTGFHQNGEGLFLFDYQVKGMMKELSRIAYPKDNAAALKAVTSKIQQFVYVKPRRILLGATAPSRVIERPLRAQTMQGPRVTVIRSDAIEAGHQIEFTIEILPGPITAAHIEHVLAHGEYVGLGQWRTGSYGRFTVAEFSEAPAQRGKA